MSNTNTFQLYDQVNELKALLFHNKVRFAHSALRMTRTECSSSRLQNTLTSFTFVPTRTVTWRGDIVAYKIRVGLSRSISGLLLDDSG
jgi:hypothetical protein